MRYGDIRGKPSTIRQITWVSLALNPGYALRTALPTTAISVLLKTPANSVF
jgi:hypothetical protein